MVTPGEAKEEDCELDLDCARYKAQKGQGGDRRICCGPTRRIPRRPAGNQS